MISRLTNELVICSIICNAANPKQNWGRRHGEKSAFVILVYDYLVGGLEHVFMTFHMGISWSQLTNSYLRGRSSTSYIIPNKTLNNFPWRSSHSHTVHRVRKFPSHVWWHREDKFSGEQARIFSRVDCHPAASPLSAQDGRTLKLYIHRPAGGRAPPSL